NIVVNSAIIATYGEQVVDTFYVKDMFGLKLDGQDKLKRIRRRLIELVAPESEVDRLVAAE
ncbi:MAG: hypothetical protein ACPGNT_04665, partial [Rhodospirillales bacterium]